MTTRAWRDPRGFPTELLIAAIRLYRVSLSGWLGGQCRYYPTCSNYAEEAMKVHGAARGSAKVIWRILRCNPFGTGGFDPVSRSSRYEHVIPAAQESRS